MTVTAQHESSGRVFDIQRFCTHDGPGIRTTVFLQGCPLRCKWCHNPESHGTSPLLSYVAALCIGCAECARACKNNVHTFNENKHEINRALCACCGACVKACPTHALTITGKTMTVSETLETVLRDKPFYENSGGGLTVSGGEPLAQPVFTRALLKATVEHGIHTCVETSGFGAWHELEAIAKWTNLFLFDLKETNPQKHRKSTGVPLKPILDNLVRLDKHGASIIIRLPLIPGFNNRPDHFDALATIVHALANVKGVEILPFHPMGTSKIEQFGLQPLIKTPHTPTKAEITNWHDELANRGLTVLTPQPSQSSEPAQQANDHLKIRASTTKLEGATQ